MCGLSLAAAPLCPTLHAPASALLCTALSLPHAPCPLFEKATIITLSAHPDKCDEPALLCLLHLALALPPQVLDKLSECEPAR